ncbi:MAG: CpsD/CapB family tyrosine-protein kinase [Dehalococcoidia bacterium]|nr:CpsD/CapB family tyrosine-protein kinase [Dehalococcoidia bacterium]
MEPRSRAALQEAMREIQVMSGLTLLRQPRAALEELDMAVGAERLQAGTQEVLPGGALLRMRMRPQAAAQHGRPSAQAATRPLAIGVTSAGFGDGKTTLSIALASSLAADLGAQVTLVDADFSTQSLAREYGLEGKKGLTDVLAGSVPLPAAVHRFLRTPLNVVAAGTSDEDAGRMARSNELSGVIDHLKSLSGFVVLDLPAALESMNAPVLAQRCDGVIVVARAGHTTRAELERVLTLLRDAHVLGVVVNRDKTSIPRWVERVLDLRH